MLFCLPVSLQGCCLLVDRSVLTFCVGKISSWIDLDSDDEKVRLDSEITLKQEIAWASHLSLQVYTLASLLYSYLVMGYYCDGRRVCDSRLPSLSSYIFGSWCMPFYARLFMHDFLPSTHARYPYLIIHISDVSIFL